MPPARSPSRIDVGLEPVDQLLEVPQHIHARAATHVIGVDEIEPEALAHEDEWGREHWCKGGVNHSLNTKRETILSRDFASGKRRKYAHYCLQDSIATESLFAAESPLECSNSCSISA